MEHGEPQQQPARVPFATVLASILGLWLCYFLLTTARSELLDMGFTQELLWRRALASAAGVGMTLGLWLVLRLFDARPLWTKIVAALLLSMPVALLAAQTNQLAFADIQEQVDARLEANKRADGTIGSGSLLNDLPGLPGTPPSSERETRLVLVNAWHGVADIAFGRYFMMLAWCALYLALLAGEKARAAERREGAYRRAAKAAELRSLRYQVNPHFLFNTLNSLSALVLTGKTQTAERMIQTISTFYRRSLADDPTADVPLREEFALQKLYLDIEAVRFPQRLRAVFDLPAKLEDARIPGMILQPLVENSVRHAVALSAARVTITIAAREEYGRLVVEVSDDGAGLVAHEAGAGHGIGLANVRDRLAARFGAEAALVSQRTQQGYSTLLRLPLSRTSEDTLI